MPTTTISTSLGNKIRQRRKDANLTLVELAEKCDISPSFLSQIERDQANPSIGTLHDIANALGQPLASFFEKPPPRENGHRSKNTKARVIRAERRKTITYPNSGIRNELLSPDLQRAIQMMYVVIPPGTGTGDEPLVHEGEECGVVLQGQIDIWVGDDEHYTLNPGDSIYQDSSIPHRSHNYGDEDVIIVVAITPPSF